MLAWTYQDLGAHDRAVAELTVAVDSADRSEAAFYLVRCLAHLAWATWCAGDRALAEASADRAESVFAQIVLPSGFAFLHGAHARFQLTRVRLAQGRAAETEPALADLLAAAERAGWLEVVAEAANLLGRVRASTAEPAAARALFERALSAATAGGIPRAAWEAHMNLADPALGTDAAEHLTAAAATAHDLERTLRDPALRPFRPSLRRTLAASAGDPNSPAATPAALSSDL
jgi:hypothetical protein